MTRDQRHKKLAFGIAGGVLLALLIALEVGNIDWGDAAVGGRAEVLSIVRIVFACGVAGLWWRDRARSFEVADRWFMLVLTALLLAAVAGAG